MEYEQKYKEALERAREIHNEHKAQPFDVMLKVLPELVESEDERIRKELITHCRNTRCVTEEGAERIVKWIAWLEKQGEQKDSVVDFKAKDWYVSKVDGKIRNIYNSVDKVEPKFKVGNWIVFNGWILHIDEIVDGYYITTSIGGIPNSYDWNIDNIAGLWTIQDAKDGDILVNWNNTIFIFKDIADETVKFHIAYNEKWNIIKTPLNKFSHLGLPEPQFEFHPATKEQRDLLFQKMKGYGYEWNEKEKRLIEIPKTKEETGVLKQLIDEEKSAWSEEDEAKLKSILFHIEDVENKDVIDWLKSLKNRVQPQTKQEWSEKDNEMLFFINELLENKGRDYFTTLVYDEVQNWLKNRFKSLPEKFNLQPKQEWSEEDERTYKSVLYSFKHNFPLNPEQQEFVKSLRLQKQWKPSDEQLETLSSTMGDSTSTHYSATLHSLYNDLKKLKG